MDMIKLYKGIAPGVIISHEIKKRKMSQKDLASRVNKDFIINRVREKGHNHEYFYMI